MVFCTLTALQCLFDHLCIDTAVENILHPVNDRICVSSGNLSVNCLFFPLLAGPALLLGLIHLNGRHLRQRLTCQLAAKGNCLINILTMSKPENDLLTLMQTLLFLSTGIIKRSQLIGPFLDILIFLKLLKCMDQNRQSLIFTFIDPVSENIAVQILRRNADELFIIILSLGVLFLFDIKSRQQIQNPARSRILLINAQKHALCIIILFESHINLADQAKYGTALKTMNIDILQLFLRVLKTPLKDQCLEPLCQCCLINLIIIHAIALLIYG